MQLGDQVNAIRHLAMFFAKLAVAVDLEHTDKLVDSGYRLLLALLSVMATVYYLLISIVS
jgi:hypothetical protein